MSTALNLNRTPTQPRLQTSLKISQKQTKKLKKPHRDWCKTSPGKSIVQWNQSVTYLQLSN